MEEPLKTGLSEVKGSFSGEVSHPKLGNGGDSRERKELMYISSLDTFIEQKN